MLLSGLSLWAGAAGAQQPPTAGPAEQKPSAAGRAASAGFEVKDTSPRHVVFRRHTGSYWELGPALAEAREYMVSLGESGPLFARFSGNPAVPGATSLDVQVGFVTATRRTPTPPFVAHTRDGEKVLTVSADASQGPTARLYRTAYAWLAEQSLEPEGPVTEVYHHLSGIGAARKGIEVQIVVRAATSEKVPHRDTPEADKETFAPRRAIPARRPDASPPAADTPAPPAESPRTSPRVQPDDVPAEPVEAPVEAAPTIPSTRTVPAPPIDTRIDEPAQPSAQQKSRPLTPEPIEAPRAEPAPPDVSVPELIQKADWPGLAERIIPPLQRVPEDLQVWLGQVVFRVRALASGLDRIYPDHSGPVAPIVAAISARYDALYAEAAANPLDHAVVRVDPRVDPQARAKQTMIRELDQMLAGLAVRQLDPAAAEQRLSALLVRMDDMLHGVRE